MYSIENKDDAIRMIQTFILELSYGEPALPHLVIDGVYGERTRRAVRIFQGMKGLPETGRADFLTWSALYDAYRTTKDKRMKDEEFLHLEFVFPIE